jgi:hypothetical protein
MLTMYATRRSGGRFREIDEKGWRAKSRSRAGFGDHDGRAA